MYSKEVISRTLCSLYASAFRVAATGTDTALSNFEIVYFSKINSNEKFFENFMDTVFELILQSDRLKNDY